MRKYIYRIQIRKRRRTKKKTRILFTNHRYYIMNLRLKFIRKVWGSNIFEQNNSIGSAFDLARFECMFKNMNVFYSITGGEGRVKQCCETTN